LRIAVSAPKSLREVTDVADKKIKQRIESINGVGQVEIVGGREREIQVWVDPERCAPSVCRRLTWRTPCASKIWKFPADALMKARAN
jgi:hypothetical protein